LFARDDAGIDPWRGWQALLGDVSISATPVPGTHLSMMEAPNVEFLGRALSREIDRATEANLAPGAAAAVPG
jgi:thioesterase domain-containing protein